MRIVIDVTARLPPTDRGNKYVLVVAEHVSKWTEAPLISNEETESADRVLFEKLVIFCGVIWDIYSDQDRDFEYALFQQLSATCCGN